MGSRVFKHNLIFGRPSTFFLVEAILNGSWFEQELAWGMLTQREDNRLAFQFLLRNLPFPKKKKVADYMIENNPTPIEVREIQKLGLC